MEVGKHIHPKTTRPEQDILEYAESTKKRRHNEHICYVSYIAVTGRYHSS